MIEEKNEDEIEAINDECEEKKSSNLTMKKINSEKAQKERRA